jgi:hypothetical protein
MKPSAGWTTYGTSLADFHSFRASPRDMRAPQKIWVRTRPRVRAREGACVPNGLILSGRRHAT